MTAIFYDGRDLYADKFGVVDDVYSQMTIVKKLHLSHNGYFAFAAAGKLPIHTRETDDAVCSFLTDPEKVGSGLLDLPYDTAAGILLTKRHCYRLYRVHSKFESVAAYTPFGLGTGSAFLEGRYYVLQNVKKAYQGITALDRLTGSVPDCIRWSQLKYLPGEVLCA